MRPKNNYAGQLRGVTPHGARDEDRWFAAKAHEGALVEVPEKVIEQDHHRIKSRVNVMLGFKRFQNAAVTISAIELMHRICKGQLDLTAAHFKGTSAPSIWMTVLSYH
jgi:transposase-like protein